jgi:hypothetical protein
VKAGEERVVTLRRKATEANEPEPKRDSLPSSTGVTKSEGTNTKTIGYVVGGVGIVGLGVGAITGIILASKRSEMKSSNCDTDSRTCAGPNANDGVSAASSGAPLVPVFYGGLAVGVIGVAAGAVLIMSSSSDSGGATALRVGPSRVAFEGRF